MQVIGRVRGESLSVHMLNPVERKLFDSIRMPAIALAPKSAHITKSIALTSSHQAVGIGMLTLWKLVKLYEHFDCADGATIKHECPEVL
jgi:hypothetical protein